MATDSYNFIFNPKIEDLTPNNYQVFFIDIEMPDIDGFTLANELRKRGNHSPIIFISSYESHVFKSFSFNPVCFIRKAELTNDFNYALKLIKSRYFKIYQFSFRGRIYLIDYKNIVYLKKYKNNVEIITLADTFQTRNTLSEISKTLNNSISLFVQVHKSVIVNLMNIKKFEKKLMTLYNGEKILISRYYLDNFIKEYYQFIFNNRG